MAELVREIMVDATPETIWPFLIDPEQARRVEGTVAEIDPDPAASTACWWPGSTSPQAATSRSIPMEKVVFTFGWEQAGNPITPGSTTVEISLHPEGDEDARAARAQRLARRDAVRTTARGGRHYLERLAVRAAGGDPAAGRE